MAKRKKKKSNLERILITVSIVFCAMMGLSKMALDNFSWFDVFAPIVVAFIIVFAIRVIKLAINKV